MLQIKYGAKAKGMQSEILLAIIVANSVYGYYGYPCVITSINDGKHITSSLHYTGNAIDLRTRNLPSKDVIQLVYTKLAEMLGPDYDVVLEKDHIHVEFDPKNA